MIVIIDFGMGNLRSVQKAIEAVGKTAVITSDPDRVRAASKVILPGVGAFADAMAELRRTGLGDAFCDAVRAGKPCLGVCLGLQLLFESSTEDGEHSGLGLLPGRVVRFAPRPGLKVPHMGWNTLRVLKPVPLLAGLAPAPSVYFVHSYYAVASKPDHVAAEADYPDPFPAVVWRENLTACQFHPEKSQSTGLAMYANFVGGHYGNL
jgi:glutamine amidotransferase